MNVLIATINIYRAARSRVRRNATRLFTRVLQLSTHCFTRETEKEIERKRERNREKGKNGEQKKKNSTTIFYGLLPPIRDGRAWTLSPISHD